MNSAKQNYVILSGEGELGAFECVYLTLTGVKRRLTKERRFDRWAHAYSDFFATESGEVAGIDIESGACRSLPPKYRFLVA